MHYISRGIGHSFINPKQGVIGDDDLRDVDIGDASEDDEGGFRVNEDALDHEGDPDEDGDKFDEDDDHDEKEDTNNTKDDDEDELGPEDGKDVDHGDEEDNFNNF
jgi:hypothetical protein